MDTMFVMISITVMTDARARIKRASGRHRKRVPREQRAARRLQVLRAASAERALQ
jgi:hypothetical protein